MDSTLVIFMFPLAIIVLGAVWIITSDINDRKEEKEMREYIRERLDK